MSRNLLQVIAGLFVLIVGALLSNHPSARADDPKESSPDKPVLKDDDAIKELRRLGATVTAVKTPDGKLDEVSVRLGGDWHGTSDDLKLLNRVANLDRLSAFGVPITDDDLKQLDGLSRLTVVELYGTKVTADGAARLGKMHQDIKVDRRRTNALFGVDGEDDPAGVRITVVQAGSPADRGGLAADDIIVKFAGHDVGNFKALTSLIGDSDPGDKVVIELRRGGESLTKEIKMGSWK
jgi:PDZ domain